MSPGQVLASRESEEVPSACGGESLAGSSWSRPHVRHAVARSALGSQVEVDFGARSSSQLLDTRSNKVVSQFERKRKRLAEDGA